MFFLSIAMDTHLHESYFVVAHFHYVLVGGTVFGFFAGIYYGWPKATGKMLSEKLGVLHFLTAFVSYNALFWPMHRLGVGDDPQTPHLLRNHRGGSWITTNGGGWWNMFITVSGFIFFFSNFIMVFNMIVSSVRGRMPQMTRGEDGPSSG